MLASGRMWRDEETVARRDAVIKCLLDGEKGREVIATEALAPGHRAGAPLESTMSLVDKVASKCNQRWGTDCQGVLSQNPLGKTRRILKLWKYCKHKEDCCQVGGSIPDSSRPCVKVSLSKILNPKLLLMDRPGPRMPAPSPSVFVFVGECVSEWMGEWEAKFKMLWVCREVQLNVLCKCSPFTILQQHRLPTVQKGSILVMKQRMVW